MLIDRKVKFTVRIAMNLEHKTEEEKALVYEALGPTVAQEVETALVAVKKARLKKLGRLGKN